MFRRETMEIPKNRQALLLRLLLVTVSDLNVEVGRDPRQRFRTNGKSRIVIQYSGPFQANQFFVGTNQVTRSLRRPTGNATAMRFQDASWPCIAYKVLLS